jgi:hypothetical protein
VIQQGWRGGRGSMPRPAQEAVACHSHQASVRRPSRAKSAGNASHRTVVPPLPSEEASEAAACSKWRRARWISAMGTPLNSRSSRARSSSTDAAERFLALLAQLHQDCLVGLVGGDVALALPRDDGEASPIAAPISTTKPFERFTGSWKKNTVGGSGKAPLSASSQN